jgi:penicillin G amidase
MNNKSSSATALTYDRRSTAHTDASPRLLPPPKPKSVLRRSLRAIAVLILSVILLVCAGILLLYSTARRALPQIDGEIRVSGLSAPVSLIRDPQGVPHIAANNAEDLFFAQGYVTAQDRLWQMDLSRRLAEGTASEVMGSALLEHDKQQRVIGLRQVGERSWRALSPRDQSYFEAYARGVNAFIEGHLNNLPMEFRVLRYSPKSWTGLDSLLCGILMSQALNYTLYETKLVRERITAKLGPELASDLYPNSSWRDHPPGSDDQIAKSDMYSPPRFGSEAPGDDFVHDQVARALQIGDGVDAPGSNNWVISGAHTVTGKPLLSNDMHLALQIPNIWYEAHLEIRPQAGESEFDVEGFTLPGLPYVLVGHNQHIAWGFTNLVPDVEDVFVENVRSDGKYETPDGWKAFDTRHEVIHVKNKPDVGLDVMLTRHGPVVTDLVSDAVPNEKRTLALKWVIYDEPVTVPFFDVGAAHNWQEFRAALSHFSGPAENIVYADVDGHIGYQAAGFIPIRKSGDGSHPESGSDNAHEWTGYIPFNELPSIYDPPSGVIATANNRVTSAGYRYSIATQWGSPYRVERIYEVLNSKKQFTADDMLKLQTDTYSGFDRFCAERFASAVSHSSKASERARQAAELMRNWTGWVSADLAAPTLIVQARQELLRLLLEPRLKPVKGPTGEPADVDWTDYEWFMSSVAIENILTQQPPRWLPASFAAYDDLLTAAVENTINEKEAPRDLASWKWGPQYALNLRHPIFGKIPVLSHWAGPGFAVQSGDRYTVKQTSSGYGPSERMTVDLANLDASNFNLLTGQSGQLFSPHYMDQWQAWYQGFSFPMLFSDGAVTRSKAHEATLIPR